MKKTLMVALSLSLLSTQAQTLKDAWNKTKDEVKKDEQKAVDEAKKEEQAVTGNGGVKAPSNEEIIEGLKEALNTGTNKTVAAVAKTDGYLKNARLFIPFPPEAQKMKDDLVKLGLEKKVNEFETSLNRAAEKAAEGAATVFLGSIKKMTVTDGMTILKGADTAATHYLKQTTTAELY
ncbi:MAG TPA: DUF4197 domain-containing protein, partial [Bacteroidia bacterium]|nr:DUF4197 domain-containing protein [Bacteroidia bacterium]